MRDGPVPRQGSGAVVVAATRADCVRTCATVQEAFRWRSRGAHRPREALRVGPGFDLAERDLSATPGWEHGEQAAEKRLVADGEHLSDAQERLFADGRAGGTRSVLLVLQGMDTAGKGGIVRHVLGLVDPQGVQLHSFGVPTEKERSQHYLQRIREALPSRRAHRGVRPVALRGRAGGPRERAGAARGVGAAVRRDQRVRAGGRRLGHGDRQGRAAGLARRSRRPGCASASSARTSTGSSTPATSTSARSGRRTRRRTRRSSTGRAPSTRPGTSCRRTTSGTRGWPSGACCATRSRACTSAGRPRTSTSRSEKARLDAQPF